MNKWAGWTEWHNLRELDWASVPSSPGAYAIATDHSINRAVGTDSEGILHVGESANLKNRIWNFWDSAQGKGVESHMAGWRFAAFGLRKHFPIKSLRVCWIERPTKVEAYKAEAKVLDQYRRKHFELPPLNYKFNWALDE